MDKEKIKQAMQYIPAYTTLYIFEENVFLVKHKCYNEQNQYIKDVVLELKETGNKWYFDKNELKE